MKQNFSKTMLLFLFVIVSVAGYSQVQETWYQHYSHNSESHDFATAMAVDASGNIYVTGANWIPSGIIDSEDRITTIKYNKDGGEVWRIHYGTGTINHSIRPVAMTVDAAGNVYIVTTGLYVGHVYTTIKYNSSGNLQWSNRFGGIGDYKTGDASDIAVDPSGNVYVTGFLYTRPFESFDEFADYVTIKYNSSGHQQWLRRYNGASPGNGLNKASSLAVDASGNVFVTGTSQLNGQMDFATIKYNTNGSELWIQRYNGTGNEYDAAKDIVLDGSGNIYVTGVSYTGVNNNDFATIKYNSEGDQLWIKTYNGPGNAADVGTCLTLDALSNIYVTGYSHGGGTTSWDYATIKYNSDGTQLWVSRYDASETNDRPTDIVVDAGNNVYVTGTAGSSIATVKYNASGVQQWDKTFRPLETYFLFFDPKISIGVDADQNIYVAGNWNSPPVDDPGDYITIRYSQCELTCPANITINNDAGKCGAIVTYSSATTSGDCGTQVSKRPSSGILFPIGTTTVTQTSNETGATCSFTITVIDNEMPVITCPSAKTVNTDPGVCYATPASVNAGIATATDNCSVAVVGVRSDGQSLNANYPVGITTITWTAKDPSNNTATSIQKITVVDNQLPVISNVSISHTVLSPPNRKMIDVTIDYGVTDNCTANFSIAVSSNEPQTGLSNGDLGPDWVIVDNYHLQLRAERDGKGDGRVYTITITASDGSGNISTATKTVVVPHNIGSPNSGKVVTSSVDVEGDPANFKNKLPKVLSEGLQVETYPNPAKTSFTLRARSSNNKDVIQLQVLDVKGRMVESKTFTPDQTITFGSMYRPGSYYIRVIQGKEIKQMKLIKVSD